MSFNKPINPHINALANCKRVMSKSKLKCTFPGIFFIPEVVVVNKFLAELLREGLLFDLRIDQKTPIT